MRFLPPKATAGSRVLPNGAYLSALIELWKPRLSLLVLLSSVAGYALGSNKAVRPVHALATMFGTFLVVGGANAINQLIERHLDARMERTRERPLPSGRIGPSAAFVFGLVCVILGSVLLGTVVNHLALGLALMALFSYVLVYTPMKTRTPYCTLVGAIPGALPPVIGWVAASNDFSSGPAILFALLYLWQLPHFFAIARLYRDDYQRAGMPMIAVLDADGKRTGWLMVASTLALVAVSSGPYLLGFGGNRYLVGSLVAGTLFLATTMRNALAPSAAADRLTFRASLIYLPLTLGMLVADRLPAA